MPVVLHKFDPAQQQQNQASPGYLIAKVLALHCADQYDLNQTFGVGSGIAAWSCWAAVAITPNAVHQALHHLQVNIPGAPANFNPLAFSSAFGNSQMGTVNRTVNVPGFDGGAHAERAAIRAAAAANSAPYQIPGNPHHYVLFVQLEPCQHCHGWLTGPTRARVANPWLNRMGLMVNGHFTCGIGGSMERTVSRLHRWLSGMPLSATNE